MKSPAQFIKLQQSLADDALNEYIHHTGSAVFACPPGLRPGQHWGGHPVRLSAACGGRPRVMTRAARGRTR
jgi:deferrochelatase/peroxidase EfeB